MGATENAKGTEEMSAGAAHDYRRLRLGEGFLFPWLLAEDYDALKMTFLEKRRIRRAFEKVVDPEKVEALLRDGAQARSLQNSRIEFVVAFVRGETPSKVSERMARVVDLAVTEGAVVHDLVGGLVIVAFGTHPVSRTESGSRASLLRALREQLASDVKIVHGAADGQYGLLGNETRMSYSFLVPKFDAMLGNPGKPMKGFSMTWSSVVPSKARALPGPPIWQ